MIPNYSMILAIRWSPAIWWSIGSMDFDNPKVYGDTSITDGLVIISLLWKGVENLKYAKVQLSQKVACTQSSSVSNNSKISPNPLIFALSLVFFWRSSQPIASAVESSLLRFCRETHSESLAAHGPLHSFTPSPPQRSEIIFMLFPWSTSLSRSASLFSFKSIGISEQHSESLASHGPLRSSPPSAEIREITFNFKLQFHFNPLQRKNPETVIHSAL